MYTNMTNFCSGLILELALWSGVAAFVIFFRARQLTKKDAAIKMAEIQKKRNMYEPQVRDLIPKRRHAKLSISI